MVLSMDFEPSSCCVIRAPTPSGSWVLQVSRSLLISLEISAAASAMLRRFTVPPSPLFPKVVRNC